MKTVLYSVTVGECSHKSTTTAACISVNSLCSHYISAAP